MDITDNEVIKGGSKNDHTAYRFTQHVFNMGSTAHRGTREVL